MIGERILLNVVSNNITLPPQKKKSTTTLWKSLNFAKNLFDVHIYNSCPFLIIGDNIYTFMVKNINYFVKIIVFSLILLNVELTY